MISICYEWGASLILLDFSNCKPIPTHSVCSSAWSPLKLPIVQNICVLNFTTRSLMYVFMGKFGADISHVPCINDNLFSYYTVTLYANRSFSLTSGTHYVYEYSRIKKSKTQVLGENQFCVLSFSIEWESWFAWKRLSLFKSYILKKVLNIFAYSWRSPWFMGEDNEKAQNSWRL